MAIYHCSIKIISRGKGQSAIAAAAYRAGEKITSKRERKSSHHMPLKPVPFLGLA